MAYRHLLVPIDGSESGFRALEKGLGMAKEGGSKVTALYVIPKVAQLVQVFSLKDVKEAFYREGEKVLGQAREMARDLDFELAVRTSEGIPSEKIIETARALNSDLIVMGRKGQSGLGRLLIGSCTQKVLAGAPCPVLVVK